MNLELAAGAKEDVMLAAAWYGLQKEGLDLDFLSSVENGLKYISKNYFTRQVIYRNLRVHRIIKFPYGIFYSVEKEKIVVKAIVHLHRNPIRWKRRK